MKNPLSYQTTEYDCGPTTLLNAVSFLFRREDIPPEIVKYIMLYCLDTYNDKGEIGQNGTSRMAMVFICNWLNQYATAKKFPIICEFLSGESVRIGQNSEIAACLQQGGAAVVRLRYVSWHYVLLTGADGWYIDLFDPYYRKRPFHVKGIEMISDEPARCNRKVAYEIFNSTGRGYYALGPVETREAILLFNKQTQETPGDTIEYFI